MRCGSAYRYGRSPSVGHQGHNPFAALHCFEAASTDVEPESKSRRTAKPDLGVANRELRRVMQQIANRCRQHLRVGNNLDVLNDGRDPES
jgi:hypothetical protein